MGNLLALGVMLCGGYFLIKLKAFYIFHPLRCMRLSLCVLKDKESFRSFALALASLHCNLFERSAADGITPHRASHS